MILFLIIIINGLGPACLKHFLVVPYYSGMQVSELGHASESSSWEERWKWQGGTCELPLGNMLPGGVKYGIYQCSRAQIFLVDIVQVFHVTMNRIVLY